ncbi:DUF397 domain-containing protein [Streptomyces poriferorum]|uniref:DUF397 domain-containing protein n=1 Tax=Streptomyces poriferorum TaxID=2798799 RepID=A0ABY9IW71_9ACTN|nr:MULTISPECIES: DUF397 domain-containing protein [Streptomyces]MBW5258913.1 DUF397 domain-containing protein [Streptomyces poriferorum]MDP5312693.1 DUF397 domain-containing protein [Streptomyces sp. Alt4]WLQ58287.1 DUF397 domain-containing protein [Streptomyces sp. Alt2]
MKTEQLHWFKSSYSGGEGGACIEVSTSPATVHIRDSKNLQAPHVDVAPAAWSAFVAYASRG